jgi:hypothetical protein
MFKLGNSTNLNLFAFQPMKYKSKSATLLIYISLVEMQPSVTCLLTFQFDWDTFNPSNYAGGGPIWIS